MVNDVPVEIYSATGSLEFLQQVTTKLFSLNSVLSTSWDENTIFPIQAQLSANDGWLQAGRIFNSSLELRYHHLSASNNYSILLVVWDLGLEVPSKFISHESDFWIGIEQDLELINPNNTPYIHPRHISSIGTVKSLLVAKNGTPILRAFRK